MSEKLQLSTLFKNPVYSITIALLVLFIAIVSWITLKTGPVVMTRFNPDPICYLAGSWRVIQGQIPHRDFHTLVGTLFYLLVALGMLVSGFSVKAFTGINVIMFILLTFWAWLIASRRMTLLNSFLASIIVGLIIAGTYHLGYSYKAVTYANLYNRYAYAMLFIIMLEQLFVPINARESDEVSGGFSTGFLLFALFFLKLTYFFAGAGIILFRILMMGSSRKWFHGALAGSLTITLPLLIYMKFDILPIFNDYYMISKVRGAKLFSNEIFLPNIIPQVKTSLLLLASFLLISPFTISNNKKTITKKTMFIAIVLLFISAVFLNLTNWGDEDIPLMALIAFIPLHYHQNTEKPENAIRDRTLIVLYLLFFLTNWSYFIKNTGSIFYASAWKAETVNTLKLCNTPTLRDYYVSNYEGAWNYNYIDKINEGLDLLRTNISEKDRVSTLNFEDPFNFGLLLKNPRGDSVSYHYTMNFDRITYWGPEKLFAETTMIMLCKDNDPFSSTPLRTIYADYLLSHFDLKAETTRWMLLERKR